MKALILLFGCLACVCLSNTLPAVGQAAREEFAVTGYMPTVTGQEMVGPGSTASITVFVDLYSSDDEARTMAARFAEGGHKALRKALAKATLKGRISVAGREGYYDLKFLRSRQTDSGRQIYGIGERSIRFLDSYYPGRSKEDEFGVIQFELKNDQGVEQGAGTLVRAARIKSLDGNSISLDNYGIQPVRLVVRKQ
jgi:hypothetical protein